MTKLEIHTTGKLNTFYLLGIGLLVIFAAILYLHYPLGYNQSLYHYQGLVLLDGGIPYTDFVEKKGSMGLLGYGLAALIFGPSPISYRLYDLLIQGGVILLLFRIVDRKFARWISLSIPAIWFVHSLLEGPGNTADVTISRSDNSANRFTYDVFSVTICVPYFIPSTLLDSFRGLCFFILCRNCTHLLALPNETGT